MSDFVTLEQMMADLGVANSSTIFRLIARGDLPPFSVGSQSSRVKAWHKSVLRMHAIRLYRSRIQFVDVSTSERKQSLLLVGAKHIRRPRKVLRHKMNVDLLGRSNGGMAEQL